MMAQRLSAEKGLARVVADGELPRASLATDAARLQKIGAVADGERPRDVLLRQQDGRAPRRDGVDPLKELRGETRGQAERRLVDEQQARLAHEGPADREHLLLPAR